MFFGIFFLTQSENFAWAIAFAMMTDFQNALISGIFGVFLSGFCVGNQMISSGIWNK